MKLVRMLTLMKSRMNMKMGHVESKSRLLGQILEKRFCSRGHIFTPILRNMVRMFALMKSQTSLKLGHVGSKTRSLSQILEKPCIHYKGHIFSQISMKLGENVDLDEILDEFEDRSC